MPGAIAFGIGHIFYMVSDLGLLKCYLDTELTMLIGAKHVLWLKRECACFFDIFSENYKMFITAE